MQLDSDSRLRLIKRSALGGLLLALPVIGYGLGYMHGSGAPAPQSREVVLSEPAQDAAETGAVAAAPAGEHAKVGDAKVGDAKVGDAKVEEAQAAATPQPDTLPEAPLSAETPPTAEERALAEAPGAEQALPAQAELSSAAAAEQDTAPLDPAEAGLVEPALSYSAAGEEDLQTQVAALPLEEPETKPMKLATLMVEPGDTLMALLTDAGIARQEAYEAITALEEVFSPRRLRAGQEIKIALAESDDAEGEGFSLVSLALQPDVETDVSVDRDDTGFYKALSTPRELTVGSEYGEGSIESSLYQASLDAGMPHGTLMDLIRVFSFDVDFQRDIHKGDGFRALYDLHYDDKGEIVKTGEVRFASLVLGGKERRYYRYTTEEGETDYFDPDGKSVRRTLMRTPIDGARLSSGFGMRKHPILGYSRMHKGTDFAAPTGTPVYAAGNGKIVVAGRNGGYGNYVRIRHNSRYQTAYAHLHGFARGIGKGSRVEQGQIIAYVGSTGRSTGPHLHYEVLVDGTQVNPRTIDLPTGTVLAGAELEKFQMHRARIEQEVAELSLGATQVARGKSDCGEAAEAPVEQGSRDC